MADFNTILKLMESEYHDKPIDVDLGTDEDTAIEKFKSGGYKAKGYNFSSNGKNYFARKSANPKPQPKKELSKRDKEELARRGGREDGSLGS